VLPVVDYKAVPMMDNCVAPAAAAASVTPVLLDHSTYLDSVQSNQHLIKLAAYCIQSVLQII